MIQQIPVRNDIPSYEIRVDLEGVAYILKVRFNERSGRWALDVLNAAAEPLRVGERLFPDYPLFRGNAGVVEGFPPGRFLLVDTTGKGRPPGRPQESLVDEEPLLYPETEALMGEEILLLYETSTP